MVGMGFELYWFHKYVGREGNSLELNKVTNHFIIPLAIGRRKKFKKKHANHINPWPNKKNVYNRCSCVCKP